jgi:hypothetical protein
MTLLHATGLIPPQQPFGITALQPHYVDKLSCQTELLHSISTSDGEVREEEAEDDSTRIRRENDGKTDEEGSEDVDASAVFGCMTKLIDETAYAF